jgi:outer membrane receptor for ferric coprogen and ferric-rhodotorulic acid
MKTITIAKNSGFSPSFLAVCISTAIAFSAPIALAQETTNTANPAAQSMVRSYNIPAQPLSEALIQFGQQSGLQVTTNSDLVEGKKASPVNGNMSADQALDQLLTGTNLHHHVNGGMVSLVADGKTTMLPSVKVSSNQLGEITENTGSYTPGTIATATRLVLTPRETPQSISVITRQEMEDFNITSIDKAMAHTPGISIVTQDSERTIYYARGFAINTFQYDGIPMERNSAYSSGHSLSDMAIYDRVEVLKGATGLLTGIGDPGATINLVRKKPTQETQGEVQLGAGRWDNYRAQIDLGGALTSNVRGRIVAAQQKKHSYQDGHESKVSVYYGIVEVDLTPSTLLTVGADYQDNDPKRSSWGGIPLFDSLGEFNNMPRDFNNGATWSHWDQYTRSAFATLEHYFDNEWTTKLQLNHQINGYDAEMAGAAAGNPDPITGTGVRLLGPTSYKGETRSDALDLYASGPFSLLGRSHELVLGVSAAKRVWENDLFLRPLDYDQAVPNFYDWSGNTVYPNSWRHRPGNDETTRENAVYATTRFNILDDLKLITGTRIVNFEREEVKESGLLVPYVGAVYDFNNTHSIYASYTTIFKPQSNRDESGRALDPLEGENYEVGTKSTFFNGRLNASVALFQLDQDNFAELSGGLTPTGQPAYRGIEGVRTRGYEFEVSGNLTPNWSLHTGYSHKVSKQNSDKVSTLTPEGQFTLFTNYKFSGSWSGMTVGGGLRSQDKTWSDVTNPVLGRVKHTAESYWLVDVMAGYRFTDQLSGQLNINNLLDEKYYTIFDSYSTYTWGEPRNLTLTLNYKF